MRKTTRKSDTASAILILARRTLTDATARIPPSEKQRLSAHLEGAAPSAPVKMRIADAASPCRARACASPWWERFEVLLEEIRDDVKASLEGHSVLKAELEQFREEVNERFRKMHAKLDALIVKIDGWRTELKEEIRSTGAQLSDKIDDVARNLAEHRADTEVHRSQYRVSE